MNKSKLTLICKCVEGQTIPENHNIFFFKTFSDQLVRRQIRGQTFIKTLEFKCLSLKPQASIITLIRKQMKSSKSWKFSKWGNPYIKYR